MGNVQIECTKTDVYWVHCQICHIDGPRTEDLLEAEQQRAEHRRMHELPAGSALYRCPLPDCCWTHGDFPPASGDPVNVASDFYEATAALARQFALGAEQGIKAHLETHTLVEWVRYISRLQEEAARLRRVASAAKEWDAFVEAAVPMSYVLDAGELERREREAEQALRDAVAALR